MKNLSLGFISFLQAAGLITYMFLIAIFLWNGERWFAGLHSYIAPLMALSLFVFSAVISALIFLGYPFWLIWEKKQTQKAIRLVIYSTAWLFAFLISLFAFVASR